MRGLVALVIVTAFVATMVAQLASHSSKVLGSPSAAAAETVATSDTNRLAEIKASGPQFSSADGTLELTRNEDGHFYADVLINGSTVHMLIDTGATGIALTRDDARAAGLATSIGMNDVVGEGADGAVHGEIVKLDRVALGPLSAEDLDAVVLNSGEQSLLGQSFLSKFSSVQIEGNRMVLR